MPLPASLATKTLHGKYTNVDGTPAIGAVTFTTDPYTLRAQGDDTIIPISNRLANLDVDGEFTLTDFASTNDPDVAPTGWVWTVQEVIVGAPLRTYQISIPYDAASTLELADLIPAVPAPAMGDYVTQGDLQAAVDAAMASSTELADAIQDAMPGATFAGEQITSGTVADARIASTITRDSELADAVADLEDLIALCQLLSEKDQPDGYAGLDALGKLLAIQIPDLAATYQVVSAKNQNGGYAGLDGSSKLTASQLPNHSGDLITSGTVVAARIDSAIARLTQVLQLNGGSQTVIGATAFSALITANGGITAPTVASETWTALSGSYQGNYSAYAGSTYYTPKYRREQGTTGDVVHLSGQIVNSGDADFDETIITGIPSAIRPGRNVRVAHAVDNSNGGAIEITSGGSIINKSGNAATMLFLDGIRYRIGSN